MKEIQKLKEKSNQLINSQKEYQKTSDSLEELRSEIQQLKRKQTELRLKLASEPTKRLSDTLLEQKNTKKSKKNLADILMRENPHDAFRGTTEVSELEDLYFILFGMRAKHGKEGISGTLELDDNKASFVVKEGKLSDLVVEGKSSKKQKLEKVLSENDNVQIAVKNYFVS